MLFSQTQTETRSGDEDWEQVCVMYDRGNLFKGFLDSTNYTR